MEARMPPRHSRRAPARGGRILLWMLLCFLGMQFLGGVALDHLWPRVRNEMLFGHLDRVRELPHPPTVVCLGSSRFGCALDDRIMTDLLRQASGDPREQVYNLAVPAGDLLHAEVALDHLLRSGIRPRLLLLEANPELVSRRNDWIKFHIMRSLRWRDVPACFTEAVRTGNLLRLAAIRGFPLVHYRDGLCRKAGDSLFAALGPPSAEKAPAPNRIDWYQMVRNGQQNPDLALAEQTRIGLNAARRFLRDYRPGGNSAAALHRIAGRCRDEGIELVLIMPPVAQAHRNLYTQEIEDAYQAFLKEIQGRFSTPIFDLRNGLTDEMFMDNHHANREGTRAFSRLVVETLALPRLRH